jgi:hypothetical protein
MSYFMMLFLILADGSMKPSPPGPVQSYEECMSVVEKVSKAKLPEGTMGVGAACFQVDKSKYVANTETNTEK